MRGAIKKMLTEMFSVIALFYYPLSYKYQETG